MIKIAAIGTSQCCCVNRSGIECTVCHFKVGLTFRLSDHFMSLNHDFWMIYEDIYLITSDLNTLTSE